MILTIALGFAVAMPFALAIGIELIADARLGPSGPRNLYMAGPDEMPK
jgi:hypothetical protein